MAQTHIVRGVATKVTHEPGAIRCFYHDTLVAKVEKYRNAARVTLNTGGYFSNTTKTRMNQFSAQYCSHQYGVYQKKGEWFVSINNVVNPVKFVGNTVVFIIDSDRVNWPKEGE